jgi:hypothetical protein
LRRFSSCSLIFRAACRTIANNERYKSKPPHNAPNNTTILASRISRSMGSARLWISITPNSSRVTSE